MTAAKVIEEIIHLPREERSEEHTSELQSQSNVVCRLRLEKKRIACAPRGGLRYAGQESTVRVPIPGGSLGEPARAAKPRRLPDLPASLAPFRPSSATALVH